MQKETTWRYLVDKDRCAGVAKRGRDLFPWRICFFTRDGVYLAMCEMIQEHKFKDFHTAQKTLDLFADDKGWRLYLPEYEYVCSNSMGLAPLVPVDNKYQTPKQRIRARFGKSLTAVAREYGIKAHTVVTRLDRGWDIDRALITPVASRSQRLDTARAQEGLKNEQRI